MRIEIHFYSYFKDLTGFAQTTQEMPERSSISELLEKLFTQFPKLESMKKSTLIAVGMDYQTWDYVLRDGDEVSLFPPVQGG